ncbi:2-polyprenyl-6-methoxyphenol hydroxylase [Flexibacter flexilis DSM 6793]|uniref:2-polyprenyl-6-methoxyphenol hydroxylase n=1 Tax=Flexibacter flexilis DSM 6793 TaxID=927664 RepID=A0A1I1IRT5_9BACT|nr:FAD-dependent monooxygenase [Flexibacter flexilis]SFC38935.1 2-polyprenyl-6-methoxyphenol hydroxylase [Flexibacter flexilis DSM 6793]
MKETVTIIGAGIGGLTTALTLKQKGLSCKVFEAAPEIKPVGAGIIIANNAMQIFRKLGVHEQIEAAGNRISYMKITDAQLNCISVADLRAYEQQYGVHNIAIHRGELQKTLADAFGYQHIMLSKRLSKIEKSDAFKLTFEDYSTTQTKFLIGADGLKSKVRNQLFEPSTLRNANQKCWRGICEIDLPEKYHHELNEAWGKGKRFGFVKISDKKVYWYALENAKNTELVQINLSENFKEFHADILKIIAATPKEKIIASDIIDLSPIDQWQRENVCLIGDAAHATTPNLGQGACQAVEDAYVLGKLLDSGIALENAFKEYENMRRKKAHAIVKTSWAIGKMAHWENDFGIWFRNFAMKNTPKFLNKKQLDMIFKID